MRSFVIRKMLILGMIVAILITGMPGQHMAFASGTGQPYCKIDPNSVQGSIGEFYRSMRAEHGPFSCPLTSNEQDWYGGRIRLFQNGTILWFPFPDHGPLIMWVLRETWNTERTPFATLTVKWKEDANRANYELEWKEPGQDWKAFDHNLHGVFHLTHVHPNAEYQFRIRGCDDRCYGWLPPIPYTTDSFIDA